MKPLSLSHTHKHIHITIIVNPYPHQYPYLNSDRSAGQVVRHGLEQVAQLAGFSEQRGPAALGADSINRAAAVQVLKGKGVDCCRGERL